MSLFSLAGFHAYVVFSLACLCGIIFRTRLLLLSTLLAGRLFSSCCSDATNTEQHNDNGSDSWHDDLLSMLATPSSVTLSCAPVSFWKFCSAAAVDWNANTPSNAVVAAASCFFVVLLIEPIALLMTTDAMPGYTHRSSAGAGPQSCGPALKSVG